MNRFPRFALFLALTLFLPALAFAQTSGLNLTPAGTDVTVKDFLNPLFGELVGIGSGGADPMSGVLGKLNAVILIVGGVLLSYGLIAGTMQTAHDGEVLGKRWSTMWVPIRTAVGTAAIVPMGKGYCVIQYVVMWMVLQGVGAANLVWGEFANNQAENLPPMSAMVGTTKGVQIGIDVLRQELCAATLNGEIEKAKNDPISPQAIYTYFGGTLPTFSVANITEGGDIPPLEQRACGMNTFPASLAQAGGTAGATLPPEIQSWFGDATTAQQFQSSIDAAHQSALTALQGKLRPIAQAIYASGDVASTANFQQQIGAAIDDYNKTLADKAKAYFDATNNPSAVAQRATQDGWATAGGWYMKYVYMQQALFDSINRFPATTPANLGAFSDDFRSAVDNYQGKATAILEKVYAKDELGLDRQIAADNIESDSFLEKLKSLAHPWETVKKALLRHLDISNYVKAKFLNNDAVAKNPVLVASDFGHEVFNTAITSSLAVMALGIIPAISGWSTAGAPLLFAVIGAMIGTGASLAFYLPVMPFILWFGVLVGWLIMVIEAVIAAPLWAVAHIHPDGDGIVGRGGQGYSLVLALMLRPALAVLGLVAAMVVVTPVGSLFVKLYWGAFALGQNGEMGPFVSLAGVTIFAVIMISLMHKIFSLIHVIPDEILKWMGGPSGNLGQTAGALGERGHGHAAAVGGTLGALGGTAAQGINTAKQLGASRRAADAQEAGNFSNAERGLGQGMGGAEAAAAKKPRSEMFASDDSKRASAQDRREAKYNEFWAQQGVGDGVDKDGKPQTAFERREDFANRMAERGHTGLGGADYDQMQNAFKSITGKGETFNMERYANDVIGRKNSDGAGSALSSMQAEMNAQATPTGGKGGGGSGIETTER